MMQSFRPWIGRIVLFHAGVAGESPAVNMSHPNFLGRRPSAKGTRPWYSGTARIVHTLTNTLLCGVLAYGMAVKSDDNHYAGKRAAMIDHIEDYARARELGE